MILIIYKLTFTVLMTGMFRGWRASLLKTPSRTGGEGEEVVVVGEE